MQAAEVRNFRRDQASTRVICEMVTLMRRDRQIVRRSENCDISNDRSYRGLAV